MLINYKGKYSNYTLENTTLKKWTKLTLPVWDIMWYDVLRTQNHFYDMSAKMQNLNLIVKKYQTHLNGKFLQND